VVCPLLISLNQYVEAGPCLEIAWADTEKPVLKIVWNAGSETLNGASMAWADTDNPVHEIEITERNAGFETVDGASPLRSGRRIRGGELRVGCSVLQNHQSELTSRFSMKRSSPIVQELVSGQPLRSMNNTEPLHQKSTLRLMELLRSGVVAASVEVSFV